MGDSVARSFRSPTGQMFPPTTAAAKIVAELHRKKGKGTGQRHGQKWAGEQRTVWAGERRTEQAAAAQAAATQEQGMETESTQTEQAAATQATTTLSDSQIQPGNCALKVDFIGFDHWVTLKFGEVVC